MTNYHNVIDTARLSSRHNTIMTDIIANVIIIHVLAIVLIATDDKLCTPFHNLTHMVINIPLYFFEYEIYFSHACFFFFFNKTIV